jgi:hypothetical protein
MKITRLLASCSLALLGACQAESDTTPVDRTPIEESASFDDFFADGDALPAGEVLSYRATLRAWRDGAVVDHTPVPNLTARVMPNAAGRMIAISGDPSIEGSVATDRHGRILEGADKLSTAVDLIAQLPAPDHPLRVGEPYTSAPPPDSYVRANMDRGSLTMTTQIESTPTAVWELGDLRVVRLDARAENLISVVASDGVIHHLTMGFAYRGVTDLVYTPHGGWRVARLTRLLPGAELEGEPTLAELRAQPHAEFTACATGSSIVDMRLVQGRKAIDVPEFDTCAR